MPKIVNIETMQAIEAAADADGHSYADMMQLAGQAVAERVFIRIAYGAEESQHIFILVGTGNNGGDGLVAAATIKKARPELEVTAYLLKPRPEDDPLIVVARAADVFIVDAENDKQNRILKTSLTGATVFVDALLGTGVKPPIKDEAAKLLRAVGGVLERRANDYPQRRSHNLAENEKTGFSLENAKYLLYYKPRPYIIAVDCPSGVNCDTGEVDNLTITADETVTFGAVKQGLLQFPAADTVGKLYVAEIGLKANLAPLKKANTEMLDKEFLHANLPKRPKNSHKGTFGKAFVVAGSVNYIGAVTLSTQAAYRVGAGLVTAGIPQMILSPVAAANLETTWVLLPNEMGVINKSAAAVVLEESAGYDALLVGPGMGDEDETKAFIENLLQRQAKDAPKSAIRRIGLLPNHDAEESADESGENNAKLPPLVIDADGLNALAKIENWPKLLPEGTILTPHPKEFSRLTGLEDVEAIQADRVNLAREKAAEWGAIVVLKGAFTVIAAPDGRVMVSPIANAALATAGTGDVLAGAIVGLLAQGLSPFEAACCGVGVHGLAGAYFESRILTASDVLNALADVASEFYD